MNIKGVMAVADKVLTDNGAPEELFGQIEKILHIFIALDSEFDTSILIPTS